MPHKLFIRPEAELTSDLSLFRWGLYDVSGQKLKSGARSDLDVISQTLMQNGIEEVDIIGLWPASLAFSGYVSLPGNQARYLQQALPFAVEDQLAQDIDSVHIAVGNKHKSGKFPVHVVDTEALSGFIDDLEQFAADQMHLTAVFMDIDLLPLGDNNLVCWVDQLQFLARSSEHNSLASRRDNLLPYLDSLFLGTAEESGEENQPFLLQLYCPREQENALALLRAEMEQYPGLELNIEATDIDDFELLCTSWFHAGRPDINLCQGAFKLANQDRGWWHQWRYVAGIAALGFLLQLGVFVGKGWQYQQEAEALGATALSEYQKAVPGSTKLSVDKLPRVIKGKLNQASQQGAAETDFLTLLGEAGYQFSRSPDKQQLAFKSINYNAQKGELVMEMQAQNFEQLDRLKQAIVSAGLDAKISSAVQEDNFFRGRISVSGS